MAPPLLSHNGVSGITGTFSFDRQQLTASTATNERGDVHALADSALTNATQLRQILEDHGHHFRGGDESEIVAHAYEEWGPQFVEHLRGACACAVWDTRRNRLLLARDRVGLRSVYFALLSGSSVAFASDVRLLLHDPAIGRDWSAEAIDAYLALGHVPAPLTAYRRISRLEPGQRLVVEGRRLRLEQYSELPSTGVEADLGRRTATLEELLRTATRRQVSAPGRTGVLYSGGLASSALLAAAPPDAEPAVTIHVDQEATELIRSDAVASRLNRVRELEVLRLNPAALAAELAAHCDGPVADPWALAQFAIYRLARRHMEAALTAHGAAMLWNAPGQPCVKLSAHELWSDKYRRGIYTRGFAWRVRTADPWCRQRDVHAAHRGGGTVCADARTWLPDGVVTAAINAARAAGLELRFPFLDEELVALAVTTPAAFKDPRRERTHLLSQVLRRRLAPALMPPWRRRPVSPGWLQAAVASMVPDVLFTRRFDGRDIVSRPALWRLWEEHRSGRRNHARRLWSLVMLELWFRACVDSDADAEPLEYAVLKAVA